MCIAFVCFTLSRGDDGEVEHHRLGLHGVSLGDGVRDVPKLAGVAADEDDVEAPARELKGHGSADARCRASDHGPRAVAAAKVRRPEQEEVGEAKVGQQANCNSAKVEGAEDHQQGEPWKLLLDVTSVDIHLSETHSLPAAPAQLSLPSCFIRRTCQGAKSDTQSLIVDQADADIYF